MDKKEVQNQPDQNAHSRFVEDKISLLSPEYIPEEGAARARLDARIEFPEERMVHKIFAPKYRTAWVALVVIGVLAASLTIPQVRVIANSFLGLFRVERIEAVDVGISLENLPREMETRFMAVDNIIGDQLIIDKDVQPVEVGNIKEASTLAGFNARIPTVPTGETHIYFQEATTIRLVINRDSWQGILNGMGYDDYVIPESADGEEVAFNLPAAVIIGIGDCEYTQVNEIKPAHPATEDCTVFLQSRTPTIEAPPGVDINRAGQILLQALGMTASEAEEFSATINWATTLVVPVPSDVEYQPLTIEGVNGIFLEDNYATGKSVYTLLWLKDDLIHALIGDGSLVEAYNSINSLE